MTHTVTHAVEVARGVTYIYLQNIVNTLITLLYFPIVLRILSETEVGVIATLGMGLALFSILGTLAVPTAVTKNVSECVGKEQLGKVKTMYKRVAYFSLTIGIISTVALLFLFHILEFYTIIDKGFHYLMLLLALDVFISLVSAFQEGFLYGLQKFKEMSIIAIANNTVKCGGAVLLLYFNYGVVAVLLGWIIGDILKIVLSVTVIKMLFRNIKDTANTVPLFSRLLRYSMPLYGKNILDYLSTYVDRLLLLAFIGFSQLAVYNVAITASSILLIISHPITQVLFPKFSELVGKNGERVLKEASIKATRYTSLIYVPAAIGLAAVAYPAMILFAGPQYSDGAVPLAILCLITSLTQVGVAVTPTLLTIEKTRIALEASILSILTNILVSSTLMPFFGIIGATLGRTSLIIVNFSYIIYSLKKAYGFYLDKDAFIKAWVSSMIMAMVVVTVEIFSSLQIILLPIYISIGTLTYLISLRCLHGINKEDIILLRNFFPKKFNILLDFVARLIGVT